MRSTFLASWAAMVIVGIESLAPASVGAQARAGLTPKPRAATKTWAAPMTLDGQPDLQGVWLDNSATPLERPKALEGRPLLTDEEVAELKRRADRLFSNGNSDFAGGDSVFLAALANLEHYRNANTTGTSVEMIEREFDNRTSLIVDPADGKIPPLTPEGRRRQTAAVSARIRADPADPEELGNDVRCITFGVPRLGGTYGAGHLGYYQILQTAGYVVLMTEAIHEARIVPLDGRPHLPESVRRWNGDSRGRWEGQTLVVDTTNFASRSNFMGSAENLHVVERFTRVAPDRINYEITLSDPTTWTKSWTALVTLKRTEDKIYEFACHEGNRELMKDILAPARKSK